MTHDDAFLQAILESPDDHTPRLVYADWLDKHGDPDRAEFIRLQVALAALPPDDLRQQQMGDRERMLLAGHGRTGRVRSLCGRILRPCRCRFREWARFPPSTKRKPHVGHHLWKTGEGSPAWRRNGTHRGEENGDVGSGPQRISQINSGIDPPRDLCTTFAPNRVGLAGFTG